MGFPSLRLAVNLSMRQFQQPGLVQGIERTLAAIGLDPGSLEIEITESVAMEDPELTLAVLNDLRQLGIRIAMDDFGTGHSSLSYLKRLPIQKLKIDRSFVADLLGRPEDAAIVRAIIEMGHSLGLTVIAEGVENEEQLAYLAENACDEVQGYGLSEPVSRQAFERFLKGSSSARAES
jgi:EAL domain-containing protein (putative c-di-GMP-specific phosphodiesterase class I)